MCVKICIVPKMFRTKHFQSFQNIKTWRNWACIRTYQKHFKLKINWKMMFYFKNMLNILFNFTLDKIRVNVIYSTSACSICQCHIENAYDYRQHHKKKNRTHECHWNGEMLEILNRLKYNEDWFAYFVRLELFKIQA